MTYRQEIGKIYTKIDNLAKNGEDYYLEYRTYIEDLVNGGQYSALEDVMITKFNISISKYRTIEEFKKDSFKKIRFQTNSRSEISLDTLQKSKQVFSNGFHYFSATTSQYLGDILEVENYTKSDYVYYDTRLYKRNDEVRNISLQVVKGLSSSINAVIPKFGEISGKSVVYGTYSQVLYNGIVYECISTFRWGLTSSITPTFSQYFTQSNIATYSLSTITDTSKLLIDKYSDAIDLLKG